MAKVNYGMPSGITNAGLTNQQIAQYLLQQQMQSSDPSQMPGYDLPQPSQQHNPVRSPLQGIADATGDIASAYIRRQQQQKMLSALGAQQAANDRSKNTAMAMAMNPNMTAQNAQAAQGNFPMAQSAFPGGQPPPIPGVGPGAGAPPDAPVPQAQAGFDNTVLTPQQRALAAMQSMGPNSALAANYAPQLMQAAQSAEPNSFTGKLGPGEGAYVRNQQVASQPLTPPDILRPGVAQAEIAKTEATKTKWSTMTPDQKRANGIPIAQQAQISDDGEIKAMPKEPGQVGPAYDANTGQPLGVVDYTDPSIAPKLATGEVLPHEPKVLAAGDVQDLSKIGNTLTQLQAQQNTFKPEYSRIIGSDSKLRGFLGGSAFNEASEWFNKTQGILLPTVKDIAGRSPQLIEEFNKNRPEPTDAADVTQRKMDNLISLYKDYATTAANTYRRGGYLGQQVNQAIGFDPSVQSQQPAQSPPKVQKWGRDAQGNPVPMP